MFARLASFVIWSLVGATAVFWALRLGVRSPQAPAYAVPVDRAAPVRGDLARLFGAPPLVAAATAARPDTSSRFHLLGVMAPKAKASGESSDYGFALIAVDGKPAKAFTVGARLDGGLVLQSVGLRTASLGPALGARSLLLEMPALAAPATGVLPLPGTGTSVNIASRPVPPPAPVPMPAPSTLQPPPSMSAAGPAPAMQAQPLIPTPNPNLPTPDSVRAQ